MMLELLVPIIPLFVALLSLGFKLQTDANRFYRDYLDDAKAAVNLKKAGFIDNLKNTILDVLERVAASGDSRDPTSIEKELWDKRYERRVGELNSELEDSRQPMCLFHTVWEEKKRFGSDMILAALVVAIHSFLAVLDYDLLLYIWPMVLILDLVAFGVLGSYSLDHYRQYSKSESKFLTLLEEDFETL